MEWNAETDVLKRIIAMLLALADLADRASGLPHPVRCLVLGILRPAEAVAREFVTGRASGAQKLPQASIEISAPADAATSEADAARLALCFRALALALASFSARAFASRPADPPAGRPSLQPAHALRDMVSAVRGSGFQALQHPWPDTS